MLTFYPETRPILDAVIIALIIWERRAKTEFEPNVK